MRRIVLTVIGLFIATTLLALPQRQGGTAPPPLPGAPGVSTSTSRQPGQISLPPSQRPAPLARPSARFSLLFLQYRRADADAAIDALAKWPEGDVIAEAVPSPNDDVWTRAGLVSLLTEAGMRRGNFAQFSVYSPKNILVKDWGLDKNFEIFSFRAYSLVKDLTRTARTRNDRKLLDFCARWYVVASSYALRLGLYAREGLQDMADHDLNDRPEVQLFIGSYWESVAGPFVPTAIFDCACGPRRHCWFEGPDGCIRDPEPPPSGSKNPKREALWGFKAALKSNPDLIEAHLRLGRFLHLIGQNIEAREHLERALRDSIDKREPFITYMAGLFLGELDEHQDRWPEAVAHTRLAVQASPGSHVANVALGEAMLHAGDRAGWSQAAHMFDGEDTAHPKNLDPWFYYRFAQYWQVAAGLREMRDLVRELP